MRAGQGVRDGVPHPLSGGPGTDIAIDDVRGVRDGELESGVRQLNPVLQQVMRRRDDEDRARRRVDDVDAIQSVPLYRLGLENQERLSPACQTCAGATPPHRFGHETGFASRGQAGAA